MAIGVTTRHFSGGDDSWMGSRHAVANARTGTLNATAFTVDNGIVKSGTPVAEVDGLLVPFDGAGTGGTEVLAGFVIDDRDITAGNEPCAVLWHGRIKTENLPVEFTAPTGASAFVFV